MRFRISAGAAVLGSMLAISGEHCVGQTGPHAVVVELFTSEGCSSCPPADALLRALDAKRTDSGQLVVGISEHVTYWNRLGWADPFSSETYTARQEAYRSRFGIESAYTPQMVVNGEREVLGSDRRAVLKAVGQADHETGGPVTIRIGSAEVSGDRVRLRYTATGGAGVDVFAVVAEDAVTSEVERGENSGRTLSHVSVARSFTRLGNAKEGGERTADLPAGATGHGPGKRHLVLFAQKVGLGPIVAVDVSPL